MDLEWYDLNLNHVVNLIKLFRDIKVYDADKTEHEEKFYQISRVVEELWKLDYQCMEIENNGTEGCPNYSRRLMIPLTHMVSTFSEKPVATTTDTKAYAPVHFGERPGSSANLGNFNGVRSVAPFKRLNSDLSRAATPSDIEKKEKQLKPLLKEAIYGRSRKRFIVPVILYKGKYLSRSATVPLIPEILLRKGLDFKPSDLYQFLPNFSELTSFFKTATEWSLVEECFKMQERSVKADVRLLEEFEIESIFDLMVEKGKVKYCLKCSSSEKDDGVHWYEKFNLNCIPYPGCEFFRHFKNLEKNPFLMLFNWNQEGVNAKLTLASEEVLDIQKDWGSYIKWNLGHLTLAYLLILLKHMKDAKTGLLVHCISGWDRTPLFVSLVRLSLWADGEIHQSLNPMQMLYFTVAYDWMLFGHSLSDRERKGEEIMLFCFEILKFMTCEHFNTTSPNFGKLPEFSEVEIRYGDIIALDSDDEYALGGRQSLSPAARKSINIPGSSSSMDHSMTSDGPGSSLESYVVVPETKVQSINIDCDTEGEKFVDALDDSKLHPYTGTSGVSTPRITPERCFSKNSNVSPTISYSIANNSGSSISFQACPLCDKTMDADKSQSPRIKRLSEVRAHYRDVLRSSFDMAGSQGVVDYTMILNYMKRFRSMN